ncbi:MAG: hypothetical protein LBS43_10635 [Prevotellaceae bacterium]|jgi:3-hydroxyacyl-[acyl-carrier-protein] dehydratase|nr:hypothetical protein [Prevotellaceae bacterium]
MKLLYDFFDYASITGYDENHTEYSIRLNAKHSIYQDHFPGNPVTPGVCIIQIVKELVSENRNRRLVLKKIAKVRYFKSINPVEYPVIFVSLTVADTDEGDCNVVATVFSGDVTFTQLSMALGRMG